MIMGVRAAQGHPQPPGLHDKSPGHRENMVGNTTEAYGPKWPGQLCPEPALGCELSPGDYATRLFRIPMCPASSPASLALE